VRKTLILSVVLAVAGAAAAIGAADLARSLPAPPLGYGVTFSASPAVPPAEAAKSAATPTAAPAATSTAAPTATPAATSTATDISEPHDLEPEYGQLSAEDIRAVDEALAPLAPSARLPLHFLSAVVFWPEESLSPPRAAVVAIIGDEDADRLLAPLASPRVGSAQVYAAADLPAARLLTQAGVPEETTVSLALLPTSARGVRNLVLVRQSAVAALGLKPRTETPNMMIVTLARPGQLAEALRLGRPLLASNHLGAGAVDLVIGHDTTARWLGAVGLALLLAAGTVLVGGLMIHFGNGPAPERASLEHLHEGMKILAGHRGLYRRVQWVMVGAILVGGLVGVPGSMGPDIQEFLAGPLAKPESQAFGVGALGELAVTTFVTSLFVRGLLLIGVPGLLPGLGLVVAAGHNLVWGMAVSPATLTLLDRLPMRGAVVALEAQAYVMLAMGGLLILRGALWPRVYGVEGRRQGYAAGLAECYRLIAPAALVLAAAVVLEIVFVAAVTWM
jgi:hypothetical protein